MKDFIKMIAPYITAILAAVGVYAESHTKMAMMEYRVEQVEKDKDDLKSIRDLLYSIDKRLSVFEVQLDERTGRK